jgi:hypothetical protein
MFDNAPTTTRRARRRCGRGRQGRQRGPGARDVHGRAQTRRRARSSGWTWPRSSTGPCVGAPTARRPPVTPTRRSPWCSCTVRQRRGAQQRRPLPLQGEHGRGGGASLPAAAPRIPMWWRPRRPASRGRWCRSWTRRRWSCAASATSVCVGVSALRDPQRRPRPDDDLFGEDADRVARRLTGRPQGAHRVRGRRQRRQPGMGLSGERRAGERRDDPQGVRQTGPSAAESRYASRLRAAETEARAAIAACGPNRSSETRQRKGEARRHHMRRAFLRRLPAVVAVRVVGDLPAFGPRGPVLLGPAFVDVLAE